MKSQASESDEAQPEAAELWILLREGDRSDRFAIARIIGQRTDIDTELVRTMYEEGDPIYTAEILYDTMDAIDTPFTMKVVPQSVLYARLPQHDEWSERYEDCLDYMRQYITSREMAEILDGEPAYQTNGERGYEAASFFVLNGISESITEWSIHQGHGPSRYEQSIRRRVEDLPEWMVKNVLESERQRWEGGLSFDTQEAEYIVLLLELEQELTETDNTDEITDLVQEFNLPIDEYLDGWLTAHDCPHCGEELIERPSDNPELKRLDCSNCSSAYQGYQDTDNSLIVGDEIDSEEAQ